MDIQKEKKAIKNLKAFYMEDWNLTEEERDDLDDLVSRIVAVVKTEAQAVPEGFVLMPKELSDEKADIQASLAWGCHLGLFKSQNRDMSTTEIEEFGLKWCRNKARDLQEEYKAMIEAQEQSHE